jgi:AcrR family transcriptional regulator
LAAALEILREGGHHALTVRAVAARAGCSTIGVYTWFGGKDGLVDAILIDGYHSFAEALRAIGGDGANGKQPVGGQSVGGKVSQPSPGRISGLMAQGFAYRAWALAHPTEYHVMFGRAVPGHVPGEEAVVAGLIAFELLRAEVVAAQQSGVISEPDTDAVAMALWGVAHGLVSIELSQPGPPAVNTDESLHDRTFALAMNMLVAGLA